MVSYWLALKNSVKKKRRYELLENIEKIINNLNYDVDFIIVEGRHDERTIRHLGYNGVIIKLCSSGLTISRLTDRLSAKFQGRRAAILVDFDEEGKRLNRRLTMELNIKGIKVNQHVRERLRKLVTLDGIYTIEGISALKRIYG